MTCPRSYNQQEKGAKTWAKAVCANRSGSYPHPTLPISRSEPISLFSCYKLYIRVCAFSMPLLLTTISLTLNRAWHTVGTWKILPNEWMGEWWKRESICEERLEVVTSRSKKKKKVSQLTLGWPLRAKLPIFFCISGDRIIRNTR